MAESTPIKQLVGPITQQVIDLLNTTSANEAAIAEERLALRHESLGFKRDLIEANGVLPGLVGYTTHEEFTSDVARDTYEIDQQVVVFARPIPYGGGESYVFITPDGPVKYSGGIHTPKNRSLYRIIEESKTTKGQIIQQTNQPTFSYERSALSSIICPIIRLHSTTGDSITLEGIDLQEASTEEVKQAYDVSLDASLSRVKKSQDGILTNQRAQIAKQKDAVHRIKDMLSTPPTAKENTP